MTKENNQEQPQKKSTVTVVSPRGFNLRLQDGSLKEIKAGVQEVDPEHADHWYMKAHGVQLYNADGTSAKSGAALSNEAEEGKRVMMADFEENQRRFAEEQSAFQERQNTFKTVSDSFVNDRQKHGDEVRQFNIDKNKLADERKQLDADKAKHAEAVKAFDAKVAAAKVAPAPAPPK